MVAADLFDDKWAESDSCARIDIGKNVGLTIESDRLLNVHADDKPIFNPISVLYGGIQQEFTVAIPD